MGITVPKDEVIFVPELTRLSPRVSLLGATHDTDRPALVAIHGSRKTLLLDAGNSPAHARQFLQLLAAERVNPDGVVLTHHHWDHTLGLEPLDMPVIAHVNTRTHLKEMQTWLWTDDALAERIRQHRQTASGAKNIQKEWGKNREVKLRLPTLTYTDQLSLDLGDLTCVLIHPAIDHADDCTNLYLPEEHTRFLGDAFYPNPLTWTYSQAGVSALVGALEGMTVDQCILSHEDEPWNGTVFLEWLRVMKATTQAIAQIAGNHEELETAVVRRLARNLTEEETEIVGFFQRGLLADPP